MADVGASLYINIEVVPLKQGLDPSHLEFVRRARRVRYSDRHRRAGRDDGAGYEGICPASST